MILGIGTDIVQTQRMGELYTKYGDKLLKKMLHKKEIEVFHNLSDAKKYTYLAKRFSAKEAFVKSIGTGFNDKIFLSDVCIINDKLGKPDYYISSNLDKYIKEVFKVKDYKVHLSISDDADYAVSLSIIETV